MRAPVVSGCDPAPVLELAEHVLDFVALTVERLVELDGALAVLLRWNAGCDVSAGEFLAEPIRVIASIGEQLL